MLRSLLGLLPPALFFLSLALIAFLLGAYVTLSQTFPYPFLRDAYIGGKALFEKEQAAQDRFRTDFWYPERTDRKGVIGHDPARAAEGFTLYTSGHDTAAFLIDMAGDVVHEWRLPFSAIYDRTSPIEDPQPDDFMYWRKAMVYPNGDLLVVYVAAGDSPWGYGIAKIDKDSNLLWKFLEQTHHDVDIAADGRIYALTHEIRFNTYEGFGQLQVPRIDDFVVVLSPEGELVKKVPVIDALVKTPYARLLSRLAWYTKGDYLHTNAIEVIEDGRGRRIGAADGEVLLSLREIDTIATLDLEREEITWALRGSWLAQHDPDLLEDGTILLFDNRGHYGPGGQSRIIEIDPETAAITWAYAGTEEQPFDSEVRGAQERLANGNTLITESVAGRIFEVTRDGDVVWDFINPVRAPEDKAVDGTPLIPVVSWAQRIDPAALDPSFRPR